MERLKEALIPGQPRDNFIYKPDDMLTYGLEFLSYIDPNFAQDIKYNYDWYMEN